MTDNPLLLQAVGCARAMLENTHLQKTDDFSLQGWTS
jgi:hypothetical protein